MTPSSKPTAPPVPSISEFGDLHGLKSILSDFYNRVFKDPMIGYLFHQQDQERLIEKELEWTAKALGVEINYSGRSLAKAHQAHPIRRGHFHRRNQLLKQTLEEHQAPESVIKWWLHHSQSLEKAILGRAQTDQRCETTADGSGGESMTLWRKP